MRLFLFLSFVTGIVVMLAACSNGTDASLDAPKKFFSSHRIGSSPDYGIIKFNDPSDHVITVHGFSDDAASCKAVADALNAHACQETGGQNCLNPYTCIALNG